MFAMYLTEGSGRLRHVPCRLQVNTSSVVLKRLMEGREGEVPLGGSDDVATR